ncbi:DUF4112 domain-containing protein [Polycyclovorans algicola]|uniref:DUF4112 domain-containing protein n=1 Tax=Polycyclovorans algicola TaxID=616992 RepID=UPI000A037DBB|nr:DUF4112 domain-containing protein [Polycyclovorans algicola]
MKSVNEGTPPPGDRERQQLLVASARLQRARGFAHWLDNAIRIPGTNLRFGLQPIIGLVPVLGDLIGLLMTGFVIVQAWLIGAPRPLIGRMVSIAIVDFFIGLIPVVGDVGDAVFKANARNLKLLETHLEARLTPPVPPQNRWRGVLLVLLAVVGVWALVSLLAWWSQR